MDENVSHNKHATIGNLSNGTEYEIESVGYDTGESVASIKIAGEEYAMNLRGMNFVVYDDKNHESALPKVVLILCIL